MKALVISDTHAQTRADIEDLSRLLDPFFKEVDMIIHAGDSVTDDVVYFLTGLKPVRIVRGNMDRVAMRADLPERLIFNFGDFRVGLIHGWGSPMGIEERVFQVFKDDAVDAIIFGHSHKPYIGRIKGVLLVNPGSPTDTRFADRNTVAILEADGVLNARIVEL